MHLADDGIARHPAQSSGDLTCAQALGPKFLQQFNPLVSPAHGLASSNWTQNPPVCLETAFKKLRITAEIDRPGANAAPTISCSRAVIRYYIRQNPASVRHACPVRFPPEPSG